MKKLLCVIFSVMLITLTLCACTDKKDKIDVESLNTLTVGVPVGKAPAEFIFNALYSRVAANGYRFEYIEFSSAEEANDALAAGQIDLSLISLKSDFDKYNEEHPEALLNLGSVCRYPYGLFLCNFEEFKDITDGATIAIPESDEGIARALLLLEDNGLLTLKDGAGLDATLDDITNNSRNFRFVLQNNETLVANLTEYEADIAVMSSELCVAAGFPTNQSACAIEEADSEAADNYSFVLLINKEDIASDWYRAVEPFFFGPIMYDYTDEYPSDLVVPSFNRSYQVQL